MVDTATSQTPTSNPEALRGAGHRVCLPQGDESDLIWFSGPGSATFERSTFGAVLERQRLFSVSGTSNQCPGCNGHRRNASYREVNEIEGNPELGDWCPVCNGSGRREVSVTQTGEGYQEQGYEPSHAALSRFGRVSRRLEKIPIKQRRLLLAYYGDKGCKWERMGLGHIFAVYPLTKAGRRFLDRSLARHARMAEQADDDALGAFAAAEASQSRPERKAAFAEMDRQAQTAYLAAVISWRRSL